MTSRIRPPFEREVKDHWYVYYTPGQAPAERSGWILSPQRCKDFDPFVCLREDWIQPGTLSDQPYWGLQIITHVLVEGQLQQRDNAGGQGLLQVGDLHTLRAGWTTRQTLRAQGEELLHSLHLWLNLPLCISTPRRFLSRSLPRWCPRLLSQEEPSRSMPETWQGYTDL